MTLSPNEEIVRERHPERTLENIIITEEVVQTDQDSASEETKSPGPGFEFVQDVEKIRRRFREASIFQKKDWCNETKWFQNNAEKNDLISMTNVNANLRSKFIRLILRCKKPKVFTGSRYPEPCNSPVYDGCLCSPGTPNTPLHRKRARR